jgi:hypothetical protein
LSNYLNNRTHQGARKSGGGGAVGVLLFIVCSILIVGGIIAYEKSRQNAAATVEVTPATNGSVEIIQRHGTTEQDYIDRGLKPNVDTPAVTNPTPTAPVAQAQPRGQFIGRSDWNRYHRLNCKYAQRIEDDKQVWFATPEDAFAKGYIPCKICKPPMPGMAQEEPGNQTNTGNHTTPTDPATPKPVAPKPKPEAPISLPVKDVAVDFPYDTIDREVINEKGVIRVEFTVEVDAPLARESVLKLAQKLVAGETAKQAINSVSIFMRSKVKSDRMLKWVCMVDWAPYGNLTRANEVTAGDYRTHKFSIFDQGFFKR